VTFTYDGALDTDLEKVRLEIGDTDSSSALFTDEEITVKLDARAGNVLLTAADLLDILANRFAQEYDFATDGQSFKRGSRSAAYAARARDCRNRAGAGGSVEVVRHDGYSTSISAREVSVSPETGRVVRGWPGME
jgi:hypothetical protein